LFSGAFSFKRGLEKSSEEETEKDSSSPPATKRRKSAEDTDEGNEDEEEDAADFNPEEEVATGVYGRVYQLPENVPVITGEEDEECTFTSRAKLYRLVRKSASVNDSDSKPASTTATPREETVSSSAETGGNSSTSGGSNNNSSSSNSNTDADWTEVGVGPIKILKSIAAANSSTASTSSTDSKSAPDSSIATVVSSKEEGGDSKEAVTTTTTTPANTSTTTVESMKFRLVMRRESSRGGPGTKVLLNASIKSYVTVAKVGDKMFRMTCICTKDENSSELAPATFLFKTKSTAEADDLYEEIKSIVDHFNTVVA